MGRQILLTVEGDAPLRDDIWYEVSVAKLSVLKRLQHAEVTIQHGKGEQEGRRHVVHLSLPIRHQGMTAEFFQACGFTVAQGTTIRPAEAVGKTLDVRFRLDGDGGAVASSFRTHDQERTQ